MGRLAFIVSSCVVVLAAVIGAQPKIFRSGIDVVYFDVAVLDNKGKLVDGLRADDFEVLEDGKPQRISYFFSGLEKAEARPVLHLGLLFDTSESMDEDLRFAQTAAVKFLNGLEEAADITLADFDTEVRIARYNQSEFARVIERIRNTKPKGWTALHDALAMYLTGVADQDGEKVLVVYTDGGDNRSSTTYSDVLDMLKASDVTVYSVGLLQHQSPSTVAEQRSHLEQIAALTGGLALFPLSQNQLDDMYGRILNEIRMRYSIGYISTNTKADGRWRKVEFKLKRPDLKGVKVRTRSGYFGLYRDK
jgi:Ca-activated chloride channel family protein